MEDQKENAIQKVEPRQMVEIPEDAPLMTRLAMMIENGVNLDVDKMAKLQEMGERYEANEARKAYAADCTIVQSKIEAAVKTAKNPQTGSMYAKLEGVIEASKPVYTEQGFSVVFYEGKAEEAEHIRVYADVLHKAGHKETYHYDVPLGGKGIKGVVNMTDIHAKATSVTYGRRYLLCMIWNIPTEDEDGNPPKDKGKPEILPPNAAEQKFIDAVCEKLPQKDGKMIDRKKVGLRLYAKSCRYTKDIKYVTGGAEYIMGLDMDFYMDNTGDEFEQKYHIEPDEDSAGGEQSDMPF